MSLINAMLWFSGIGWDTKMRDIGWVYVIMGVLIILSIKLIFDLRRTWNRGWDD